MKHFYFILCLVSSAVWSQVDCSLPTIQGTVLNFDATFNAISGNYNATTSITSIDEISNTNYLAPEIKLNDGFKATAGSEVLISIENCPNCECVDNFDISFGVSSGGLPNTPMLYWYTIDFNNTNCENEDITFSWDFGNGITYSGITVLHPWTSMYQSVTITATLQNDCSRTLVKSRLFTPPPASTPPPPPVEVVYEVDLNESITINAEEILGLGEYNWYDDNGNLVYQGKELYIPSTIAEKYHLEVILENNIKNYSEVEISLKPNRFVNLYPNPSTGGNLNIQYKINEANSAFIMIFSYYMSGGISYNYLVDMSVAEKNIDISNLPFGLYKVALITDGQIVDVKILSKL